LNCSYCDTKYARNRENGRDISVDELLDEAGKRAVPVVEITGGEPMLQPGTVLLCEKLMSAGFTVLLETNGSVSTAAVPDGVIKIIDCKCPSSGEADKMDFANFAGISADDEIKFVISGREDYEYAGDIIRKYDLTRKVKNILVSPAAGAEELSAKIAEWILADRLNVRLQIQLHKIIWPSGENDLQ
jgi:7-carboxy-7-deazaguanine synthase